MKRKKWSQSAKDVPAYFFPIVAFPSINSLNNIHTTHTVGYEFSLGRIEKS